MSYESCFSGYRAVLLDLEKRSSVSLPTSIFLLKNIPNLNIWL
jgi:hypothetical protein